VHVKRQWDSGSVNFHLKYGNIVVYTFKHFVYTFAVCISLTSLQATPPPVALSGELDETCIVFDFSQFALLQTGNT